MCSTLCLEDFADATKTCLVASGSLTLPEPKLTPVSLVACPNRQGFFSFRTIGLVKPFRSLVAVFTDGKTLKLVLAGNLFDLMDENARAYTRTLFPFAKSFTLQRNGQATFRCCYWFVERDDLWPENDIFSLVVRLTSSEENKRRSMLIWNEMAAGADVTRPEFLNKLV
jgi:hypothetical protein